MLRISNLNNNKTIVLDQDEVEMLAQILDNTQDAESMSTYEESDLAWDISFHLDIFPQG